MDTANVLDHSTNYLLQLGVAGIFIIFLVVVIYFLWKHLQHKEAIAKERTDEFMLITRKYVENETQQSQAMKEHAKVMNQLKELILAKLLN